MIPRLPGRPTTWLSAVLLVLAPVFGFSQSSAGTKPKAVAQGTLLLASEVACTVKIDGEKMADLQADEPKKVSVAPGEYLVTAATANGQKFSKVVRVAAGGKTVVKIDFGGGLAPAPAAASRGSGSGPTGTLLVFADAPVLLEVDTRPAGELSGTRENPGSRELRLSPGKHFLKATSESLPEITASADVQIREGAQEIVRAMVADQVTARTAELEPVRRLDAERDRATDEVKSLDLGFLSIPAGSFKMGCSSSDKECSSGEKPRHDVRISRSFQLMATEVTAKKFRVWSWSAGFEPPDQPSWSSDDVPVVNVTWADAKAFCSAFGGRLPTEAEWEYAARAGSEEVRYAPLDDVAWYADNSGANRIDSTSIWNSDASNYGKRQEANRNQAHPVGRKKPNAFGLFDMLGNAWEWTADWFDDGYYKQKVENDPRGPASGKLVVLRGGSWYIFPRGVRASSRSRNDPAVRYDFNGFRCARDANSPVTVPSSPDLKRLPPRGAAASKPGPGAAGKVAPAAIVADDFLVVKRRIEDARRREEEAKKRSDEAARKLAEQERMQAEADARALAAQMAADDRADNAAFAQQLAGAAAGLAQSAADLQRVRRRDLSPVGIAPTPPVAQPAPRASTAQTGTAAGAAEPNTTPPRPSPAVRFLETAHDGERTR